jgi:hypothetical protein
VQVFIPKVFLSYSHDSPEHKTWVLNFATRLRNAGVDAVVDQWDLQPGDDIARFMEKNLAGADRVLMICTSQYVEKANAGSGGVGYEKTILTAALLRTIDSNKVIPIIRQAGSFDVPTFFETRYFLDFSTDAQNALNFDELVHALHNIPFSNKPPVSVSPFTPAGAARSEVSGDVMLEVMKVIVADSENAADESSDYGTILFRCGIPRPAFDSIIAKAKSEGLLTHHANGTLKLTENGKHYTLQLFDNQLTGRWEGDLTSTDGKWPTQAICCSLVLARPERGPNSGFLYYERECTQMVQRIVRGLDELHFYEISRDGNTGYVVNLQFIRRIHQDFDDTVDYSQAVTYMTFNCRAHRAQSHYVSVLAKINDKRTKIDSDPSNVSHWSGHFSKL